MRIRFHNTSAFSRTSDSRFEPPNTCTRKAPNPRVIMKSPHTSALPPNPVIPAWLVHSNREHPMKKASLIVTLILFVATAILLFLVIRMKLDPNVGGKLPYGTYAMAGTDSQIELRDDDTLVIRNYDMSGYRRTSSSGFTSLSTTAICFCIFSSTRRTKRSFSTTTSSRSKRAEAGPGQFIRGFSGPE